MKRWLRTAAGVLGLLAVAGFLVSASGLIPTAASAGHWAITEWFLRFTLRRSVVTHSLPIKAPENLRDPKLIARGAGHYEIGCRQCHGTPGGSLPPATAGMLPPPPELAGRVRASEPEQLFYVVKHGLKFTGMPAWPTRDRDDEVWSMVAFLLQYPQLDAADYRRLTQRDAVSEVPTRVQACAACHGADGLGGPHGAFPKLAGQRAPYLRNALEAYATGRRYSGTMKVAAAGLSPQEREMLAEHYAALLPTTPETALRSAEEPAPDAIGRGKVIAQLGLADQRVPACIECHGPGARRGRPEYPLLAGQPADYLFQQLTLFKEQRRGGAEFAHLMERVAAGLTKEQMRDVAAYFASLPAER